jgi:hypothetical protein
MEDEKYGSMSRTGPRKKEEQITKRKEAMQEKLLTTNIDYCTVR